MIIVSLVVIVFGGVIGGVIGENVRPGAYGDMESGSQNDITADVITGMFIATGVAVVMLLFGFYGGSGTILAISGAKRIEKQDDPQLFNVVEEMAIAGGLPMPQIYLIDDSAPNAFATGRDPEHSVVAITTGLRTKLTRDELQGVIAHEMSHIRNYDIRFAMLMAVLVGLIALMADFFLRYLWFGGGRRSRRSGNSSSDGGAAVLIMMLVAIVLSIIAPIIAKLIQLAVSRQREYLADASAVELTRNPDGLAGALAKIAGDKEVLESANRATQHLYIVNPIKSAEERAKFLFSTHPPIKERIARIMSLKHA
ncbi:MAG: M48 family metallopeptidase [Phycisphaerae bacterium]|nr:M48 family metallopeptidase [Phycisphaerae bacterium]